MHIVFKCILTHNLRRKYFKTKFFERYIFSPISTYKMKFKYPQARRDNSKVDDYFGFKVPDPYQWLEDPDAEETKEFVKAQNNISSPYLNSCPNRDKLKERFTQLMNFERYGCPRKYGNRYFFSMNTGLQNQNVMYWMNHLDDEPKVFFDPNLLSEDGTTALGANAFSENGDYFAYSLSESGSDMYKIKVKTVATLEDFPEELLNVKYSGISWTHDHKGFFYSGYDESVSNDGTKTTKCENHKMYYHRIGTEQSSDILCIDFPEYPAWIINGEVSDCGKYLLLTIGEGCQDNQLHFCDINEIGEISGRISFKPVVNKMDAKYSYITNEGPICTILTNKNAPNYHLVNVDLNNPNEEQWTVLLPEHNIDVLEWATCVDHNKLIICYMQHVKNVLQIYDLQTVKKLHEFPLECVSIDGFFGKKKSSEIFYRFSSFLTPGMMYRCDLSKYPVESKLFREIKPNGFECTKFKANQVFYPSKDGTKIPMFIISPLDFARDGNSPTLLYGYGGFNISQTPNFSVSYALFLQYLGGIIAVPALRGGGEYGEKWHKAGSFENKQNVFDDFHAAAEYLIQNKYTCPKKLAIQGASNGGLLVGACANQRPELYGCVIAQVGVMDMLKFHKFTIGYAWKSDYGCAEDDKEQFNYIYKYSPLHNIKEPKNNNVQYPSLLVMTADHDDRVVPLHSLKFIAELQHQLGNSTKQTNPLMARIETKAGHGAGKSTTKKIEECVDIYSFIINSLDIEFKD